MIIYPTGECFEDCTRFMINETMHDRSVIFSDRLIMVHAILIEDRRDYSHCWIEKDKEIVIESGILNGLLVYSQYPIDLFYRRHKIRCSTKYTCMEAYYAEKRVGHPPPYERKYIRLCRQKKHQKMTAIKHYGANEGIKIIEGNIR